jgi:hypothetical protein
MRTFASVNAVLPERSVRWQTTLSADDLHWLHGPGPNATLYANVASRRTAL